MQPIVISFFGISGAGKGTQSELLEKVLKEQDSSRGILRPEMGSLLRTFVQSGTALAEKSREVVNSGGLMPSFMPIYLLTEEFNKKYDGTQHIILDGVCRRPDQSRAVDEMVRFFGCENLHVIMFTLSEESARERLLARGRADDVAEAIAKRFSWYQEAVVPAAKELERLGWTMHEIDAEPSIETIHENIRTVLGLKA